ncbi:MAG: LLM class flavin-dependent oxidoreductase, partial [Acidimicrobiia bacterium]
MKYAFNIPNFGSYADAAAVADLAAVAEQSGWDGFVVWDHIVIADGMPVGDPWVILTAVAMKTERIMIGPMVTPLPRRRPWVVARQTVTLDHLSGGRLVLGVGIGVPPEEEFGTFGEPTSVRE